jgi:predicted dehydrogenase
MSRVTRRAFLKSATAAGFGAGIVIAGTKASGSVLGANDTIRVAVCGIHGRGQSHIDAFGSMKGVQVTYLIDPDKSLFETRSKRVKQKFGNTPKCVQDYREMLDDPEVDAVSIATTNHWHAPLTVFACQAKKDVYVEKPCSHNVFEGRQAVEAARKYGRVVQHGTQSRGSNSWAQMTAAARSGKYGKLLVAKGYCCKPRWSIGFKEIQQPPEHLDYNLWLGPAPQQPFHGNLVHYNWHWFWDFGNGDMGNQGVHQMDLALWGIPGADGGSATLPKAVIGFGKRVVEGPNHADQGQTPNQELCVYDYGDHLLVFETRGLVGKHDAFRPKVTDEYYTSEGVIKDGKFFPKGSKEGQSLDVEYEKRSEDVFANFITCVRDRAPERLYAPIEAAHSSAALCHLGNISYRVGEGNEVSIDKVREAFSGFDHEQVEESISIIDRNIRDVFPDLADVKYQLGPKLAFDPEKEKFVDNEEANRLLTRDYREPFVVPKEV